MGQPGRAAGTEWREPADRLLLAVEFLSPSSARGQPDERGQNVQAEGVNSAGRSWRRWTTNH